MAFRHEVLHVRRQKQRLIDIPGPKILAHSQRLNQTRLELNSDYSDRLLVTDSRNCQSEKQTWPNDVLRPHVSATQRCAASLLSGSGRLSRRRHRKEYTAMTDYVLIHGAWHGSWCWLRVRRLLAAGAHRVFTPTLTGVGERFHLLSRDVGLDTHVADVANLMIWESLRDIVL